MASQPTIVSLNEWEWTKVATNVVTGSIHRLDNTVSYYQTYRATGGAAPSAVVEGTIPEEAVKIFEQTSQALISSVDAIDVYIMCANKNDNSVSGKLRIDI